MKYHYLINYIEINNKTLLENVKEIKKEYNNYKYYIGVVKANAYGHGYEIIKDLVKGGINYFATSSLEESLEVLTDTLHIVSEVTFLDAPLSQLSINYRNKCLRV